MLPIQLNCTSRFLWPKALTQEPYRALKTHQLQKVAAVAAACLAFLSFQWSCSLAVAGALTFTCSAITLISETFLRKDDNENSNWTHTNFNKAAVVFHVALRLCVLPIVLGLFTAFGITPLQSVAIELMSGNMKMILLATIVAPIAEEILFRGFIQERLEDLVTLTDRYICRISDTNRKFFSSSMQALLFGALHITGEQVIEKSRKIIVFGITSLFGYILAESKNNDKSLLSPIAIHAAQNTGCTIGLLAAGQFMRLPA